MKLQTLACCFIIFIFLPSVQNYKILSLFTQCSKSHLTGYLPLANELVSRGHEVTIVHPFEDLNIPKRINSIVISIPNNEIITLKKTPLNEKPAIPIVFMFFMRSFIQSTCQKVLVSKPIQTLLKSGLQYDVVIVNSLMNECPLAIAPLLGKYIILHSSGPLPGTWPSPAPRLPSVVPNPLLGLPSKMNFQQRLINYLTTVIGQSIYKYYVVPSTTPILQEIVPEAPTVWDAWKMLSLYIVNQDIITVSPRPSVPNMILLSGPACRDAKPLSQELEEFMQNSGNDGVIIFGLGSFAESRSMPSEITKAFLQAFSRLKQKVIWKYEDDSLITPPNVKIMSWMPQQDLLGHPKTKLFITHGGISSLQEAVYHNVPVIGIPLFADQPGNVERMKEIGVGEKLMLHTVTEEEIYETVSTILSDQRYYEKMSKYSTIFKDVIQAPAKKGAFWVEYVVRHNGAKHLRTLGEDMCFIQYFLIDVIAFLTITPLVCCYLIYKITKYTWRKFKNCKKTNILEKKKVQ